MREFERIPLRNLAVFACLLSGLLLISSGCSQHDGVERYQVPKETFIVGGAEPPPRRSATPPGMGMGMAVTLPGDRILGLIVRQGNDIWYFKAKGYHDVFETRLGEFEAFLDSLKFEAGEPRWQAPAGWREEPAQGMRFATLKFGPEDRPIEMSVTRLPIGGDDFAEYLLNNINRWRTELKLPDLSNADGITPKMLNDDVPALLVDIRGEGVPSQSPATVSGQGRGGDGGAIGPAPPEGRAARRGEGFPFEFEAPAGWQREPATSMQPLAFSKTFDDQNVRLTVTPLSATNDFTANVNRWRTQAGLPAASQEEVEAQSRSIEMGSVKAEYIEVLAGDADKPNSTLGAMAVHGDAAWFFALKGPADSLKVAQPEFEAFLKSVKFGR